MISKKTVKAKKVINNETGKDPSLLNPRKEPSQKRSIDRVQKILDVVAVLLERHGAEAITTNMIALEAEIPIGSLYQYFPNKHAVLNAVGQRHLERVNLMLSAIFESDLSGKSWEDLIDSVIDSFANFYLTEPGFAPLWSSMKQDPELIEIDRENNIKIAENVSMILSQFNVDPAENKIISRIVVEVTDAILNRWIREQKDKEFSNRMIIELKIILKSYLTRYFPEGQETL
ncbi:AcrR family transcriptional regulator [Leptospira yasudae]|uniref:AcrR family transcriptional regulator n=1 Tax=Leptospira yasudae TaxID=2202201 RepID=A0ABX9M9N9_9LEPT|nr:TetR/AcrR family transcriptional regulator [Leptospira yasudae]MBW0433241.1 TetR/AcrR family transcriptional regulator [Leptospira yasudae]RHX82277.1 AcrR family transcriptional regulator [Leptospira yasudae]RHX94923.1 AcrR family transcriptional regulator [Leptospira yasudae]TGK30342.1 TetR/AcrR family transcriptional regulator [Leptospira yasudae]TGM04278.1 TetR/AcrR family transcriptional regulator [Leptospira yasudae]